MDTNKYMDDLSLLEPIAKQGQTECPYCGDSPVRHFETFCNETIASAANQSLSFPGMHAIHGFVDGVSDGFARFFIALFRAVGAAYFSRDISRARTLRSAQGQIGATRRV